MKKICKKCKMELARHNFVKYKNCKDGYEGTCKDCKNKARKEKYKTLIKVDRSGETKICKRCNQELPYSSFAIDLKARDGYRNICKSCDYTRIKKRTNYNKLRKNSTWWNTKADSVNKRGRTNLEDKITGDELHDLYNFQNGLCFYCGVKLESSFHIDHKVPISKGGKNIITNMVCCCPDCNRLKWNRTHDEFLKFMQEYANRIQYSLIRTEGYAKYSQGQRIGGEKI